MSKKTPDTKGKRKKPATVRPSSNLRLRIQDGHILARASANLAEFQIGIEVLELLRIIDSHPGLIDAPAELVQAVHQALTEARNHIPSPRDLPALLDDMSAAGVVTSQCTMGADGGFSDPWIQWAMLADTCRVARYGSAIAQNTSASTRAIDVGAGNGVLSHLLLKAGAKRVLAIEESTAARVLTKMLSAPERFKVVAGHSRDATLPADTNLIVSELFGHDPFSEGMLETIRDIQTRLAEAQGWSNTRLHPQHRPKKTPIGSPQGETVKSIPRSVTAHWACAQVTSGPLSQRLELWNMSKPRTRPQRNSAPLPARRQPPRSEPTTATHELLAYASAYRATEDWSTLSFPFALRTDEFMLCDPAQVALHLPLEPVPPVAQTMKPHTSVQPAPRPTSGTCILVWFTAELAPGIHISSLPSSPDACHHWSPLVLPLRAQPDPDGPDLRMTAWVSDCQTRLRCRVEQGTNVLAAR